METVLRAPPTLGLEERARFRREAVGLLRSMPEASGQLVIDFSRTRSVDSAGLGALLSVQRQAAARAQRVALRGMNEEIRHLLKLTKLDGLFTLPSNGA